MECKRATDRESAAKKRSRKQLVEGGLCNQGHKLTGNNLGHRFDNNQDLVVCLECRRIANRKRNERYKKEGRTIPDTAWHRKKTLEDKDWVERANIRKRRQYYFKLLQTTLADQEADSLARIDKDRPSSPWVLLAPKPYARQQWDDFNSALKEVQPKCVNQPEDFADYAEKGETPVAGQKAFPSSTEAKILCQECPLFDLCGSFAGAEMPSWGVWAGKRYVPDENDKTGYRGKVLA